MFTHTHTNTEHIHTRARVHTNIHTQRISKLLRKSAVVTSGG